MRGSPPPPSIIHLPIHHYFATTSLGVPVLHAGHVVSKFTANIELIVAMTIVAAVVLALVWRR
jgi:hypothetical protein